MSQKHFPPSISNLVQGEEQPPGLSGNCVKHDLEGLIRLVGRVPVGHDLPDRPKLV